MNNLRFRLSRAKDEPGLPLSDDTCGEPVLACPACGFDYSHVRSAYTALGCDPGEGGVPYEGTQALGTCGHRRDCLVITVDGECDHTWEIRFQQHKGNTFVTTRVVETEEAPAPAPEWMPLITHTVKQE